MAGNTMQFPIQNKSIWRTWILVVLWVFQIILEVIVIGVNGLRVGVLAAILAVVNNYNNNNNNSDSTSTYTNGSSSCVTVTDDSGNYQQCTYNGTVIKTTYIGVYLAASVFALCLGIAFFISHIVQITQYARHRLTPKVNFGYDCFRFVATTITFLINIVAAALGGFYVISFIFIVGNWLLYFAGLVYASIIFRRYRRGDYNNLLPTTHQESQYQSQTVYPNKQEVNYSAGQYQPQYQQPGAVPAPQGFRH